MNRQIEDPAYQINQSAPSYASLYNNNNYSGYPNGYNEQRHQDLLFNQPYGDYAYIDEQRPLGQGANGGPINYNAHRDVMKNIEINPVSNLFFSQRNVDHIQMLMIQQVCQRSGGKFNISKQDQNELLIIMRSIYLQYAKHLPHHVNEQVAELNKQVIYDTVPRLLVNIEQHLGYMRDHGRVPMPMARGQHISSAGTKTTKGFSSVFI